MRLIHAIAALLLLVAGLVVTLLSMSEPAATTGMPHADVVGMNAGGDGATRLGGAGPVLLALQSAILVLMHLLVALGVAAARRTPGFRLLLGAICTTSLAVWWGMYASYGAFLETGETARLLGFPLPTTLALLGVPLASALLCALYVLGFRRFVYTPEDERAYEALRAHAPVPRVPEDSTGR